MTTHFDIEQAVQISICQWSELNIDEEMSNVSIHIPQNVNWIWSQKGRQLFHKVLQIVSNPENETGESSAAQTLLSKTFQHDEDRCDISYF